MSKYQSLLAQREALEKEILNARREEISAAVAQVRALVEQFELTQKDVFSTGRTRGVTLGSKVAAKYRDPATGKTWTGRGKAPKWIDGQERSQFAI